jgi:hypothetical protein
VTLLSAPPPVVPLCFFERFCWNYHDPDRRFSEGTRDSDDPALSGVLGEGGVEGDGKEGVDGQVSSATGASVMAATAAVFLVCLTIIVSLVRNCMARRAYRGVIARSRGYRVV